MKTVIEMAREAGARAQQNKNCDVEYLFSVEQIEQLLADEREACAKVCEEYETNNDITATWLNIVAEAIRNRSNT